MYFESTLDLSVFLFPCRRYLVEATAPRVGPLPRALDVPLLLEPPEKRVDRIRRDAHRAGADLLDPTHDAVPVRGLFPHDVQNKQRKHVPRLDLAQEDILRRSPLNRPPNRLSHSPLHPPSHRKLVKVDNNTDNKFA